MQRKGKQEKIPIPKIKQVKEDKKFPKDRKIKKNTNERYKEK